MVQLRAPKWKPSKLDATTEWFYNEVTTWEREVHVYSKVYNEQLTWWSNWNACTCWKWFIDVIWPWTKWVWKWIREAEGFSRVLLSLGGNRGLVKMIGYAAILIKWCWTTLRSNEQYVSNIKTSSSSMIGHTDSPIVTKCPVSISKSPFKWSQQRITFAENSRKPHKVSDTPSNLFSPRTCSELKIKTRFVGSWCACNLLFIFAQTFVAHCLRVRVRDWPCL